MCACTLHKGRPSSEWSCHWITFILAVSKEASSCKSTHMNLPDSKEDGALPTEVTRTIHLYICIFILTVNVCSRAPHPGWLHFYLSISLLETKAARVDPSPDGISPLSLSRGVSLWCFSFTQQLQHHFRFCFKRLGKKKKKNEVVQIRLVGNNAVSARPSSSPPPPYCWLGSMRDPGRLAKPLFLINCH